MEITRFVDILRSNSEPFLLNFNRGEALSI